MKGDRIPRTDHVAIYWQPSDFEVDAAGNRSGLKSDAFRVDDDGISSNWVEFEYGTFEEQLKHVSNVLATLRCVRASHQFGIINIGHLEDTGAQANKDITAIHDPIDNPKPNPGHALIIGISSADYEILQALTLLVEIHSFSADALAKSKALFLR